MFVMSCPNLVVVTDHAPLLGIFCDHDLAKITNPILFKLKEKTMMYRFSIQYCPGKWHRGSDAISRNVATKAILEVLAVQPMADEEEISLDIESYIKVASVEAINDYGDVVGSHIP